MKPTAWTWALPLLGTSLAAAQDGIVYESDLGERSHELSRAMTEYNPDASWERAE